MSGGWQGSDRKARLPSGWAKIRARILERDPICTLCGVRPSTHCDHIVAKADDHGEQGLQGVCGPCHDRKSSAEGNEAQRNNPRPGRTRPPEQHPGLR
ncbi:HNH endonuclease signature motif containing protein [Streptomyces sp. NPDC008137]|uniref:HNH endonuclease signature motif containing protein n=1 Tax=Streptomyces sp. NPDC008137 TaxID=3364813 RepID=UPI0036E5E69B